MGGGRRRRARTSSLPSLPVWAIWRYLRPIASPAIRLRLAGPQRRQPDVLLALGRQESLGAGQRLNPFWTGEIGALGSQHGDVAAQALDPALLGLDAVVQLPRVVAHGVEHDRAGKRQGYGDCGRDTKHGLPFAIESFRLWPKPCRLTQSPSPQWGEGVPPVAAVATPHPALRAALSLWER